MKLFQFLSRKNETSTNNDPTISSLKSEELWQFIQRPEGIENAETRAADLADIWAKAQSAASRAARGTGNASRDWVLTS